MDILRIDCDEKGLVPKTLSIVPAPFERFADASSTDLAMRFS